MNRFNDKVVVVTGGCRGIGLSIVEKFANEGAKVYALDFKLPNEGEQFLTDNSLSDRVKTAQVDVSNLDSVTAAMEYVIKDAGRIDVLINNAGITRDNLLMRMSEAEFDSVINTNLKGSFLCIKAVTRQMMGQRSGRIINIGSIVGTIGNAGQTNYSSSKAGMIGLTKSAAKELASRNILVNLIAPGFVITAMTHQLTEEQKNFFLNNIPLKRGATPDDIANVAIFLAGEESSYITGQVIHVDGGLYM
jgi:3-oxoacyl-[acyl-carrier protein] reductase